MVAKRVTKEVDVLVQGSRSPHYKSGHAGEKLTAARALIKKGHRIHVIGEADRGCAGSEEYAARVVRKIEDHDLQDTMLMHGRMKQEDMKPFTDRRRAERDEVQGVKDRAKEIAFRSEADLDAALAEMEHRITHESIPLSEEKNIVKLIKKYNSQREMIREYESARVQVAANRLTEEEREEVSAAIVHLKADLSNLRKQEGR